MSLKFLVKLQISAHLTQASQLHVSQLNQNLQCNGILEQQKSDYILKSIYLRRIKPSHSSSAYQIHYK